MAKKDTNKAGTSMNGEEKIVTKYDRKVQKRQEEALKAKRHKKIFAIAAVVVLIAALTGAVVGGWVTYNRVYHEFIAVDEDPVSEIEFDFYYSLTKQSILSQQLSETMTYAQYLQSYMGYDAGKADKAQQYAASAGNTWYDYFANATVSSIKEYKALAKAADEKGFQYEDGDEDYRKFTEDFAAAAGDADKTVKKYYKEVFGRHASEKNLKTYIYEYLKAVAYQEELRTELAATEDEIKSYYEEHKDDYDTVDYRILEITAREEGDEASMAEAKSRADEMLSRVTDEDSFVALCPDYATDEQAEEYDEEGASLQTLVAKSSLNSLQADWLFDSGRTAGDTTVLEDTDNSVYYVLYFINRSYNSDHDETIGSILLSNKYSEMLTPYTEAMAVKNTRNRIKMLEN